ncbi:MAG: hypothetical protein ACRCTE_02285 [Cellulosilyticaceae bacterium]
MSRRPPIPKVKQGKKICIICEGFEEDEYMKKLIELGLWSEVYDIKTMNAESEGKIAARYQETYQSDSYDLILIFCDTDGVPYESYQTIKRKINDLHANTRAANEVIVFGNPCTMQIILLHFEEINLVSHKKEDNKAAIKRLTGVGSYRASQSQRDRLFAQIDASNYELMKTRVTDLPNDDTQLGSSNFGKFLEYLSESDTKWITDINKILETEEQD